MVGGLERLLAACYRVATEKLGLTFPPALALPLMRWSGMQSRIAARHYAEAHAFASKGEYDKSIRACRASIEVQPDNVAAYEVLAQILAHLQRYEDALEACAEALTVKPNSAGISASLHQLLPLVATTCQPDRVIAILQKCLTACPTRADVLMRLIEILRASHRYVEAVQACQRLLEVDPECIPAVEAIQGLLEDPGARSALADVDVTAPSALMDDYDRLVAGNVVDALLDVMANFYGRLGVDPQTVPLVQALESSRRKLSAATPEAEQLPARSLLILFERAWKQHQAGQTEKSLRAFETIINDATARQRASYNPVLKEAVVRSGEILGRHYDTRGDATKAVTIYRNVLSVDPSSLIARRLIVLLSRGGRLAEAAEFADTAIISRTNLFRRLPANPHIAALKSELFLEPQGVFTEKLSEPAINLATASLLCEAGK